MYPTATRGFGMFRISKLDSGLGRMQRRFWVCGHCLRKWSWASDGPYQLIIFGDPQNLDNNLCCYMGEGCENDDIRYEFAVLKGSAVKDQIGTQPINTNTILRALELLGARAERQLMKRFKTVTITAGDVEAKYGTPLFCENPILSIPNQGKNIRR